MSKFRLRLEWTAGTAFVAVLCAIAALIGGFRAFTSWHYLPPTADACGLVRSEIVDTLVPGHDPAQPLAMSLIGGNTYEAPDLVFRHCEFESATTFLGIAIWHLGQGPSGSPLSQARTTYTELRRSMIRAGARIPGDLGDESIAGPIAAHTGGFVFLGYLNDADFPVVAAYGGRLGTYVVQVVFGSDDPITGDSAAIAVHTVFQEVLSHL